MNKIKEIFKKSVQDLKVNKIAIFIFCVLFLASAFYPLDRSFYEQKRKPNAGNFVHFTENYMRFSNNCLQVAVPLLVRDFVGLAQTINVSIATTITTHTFKKLLNNQKTFNGERLGQRPKSPTSNYNMPSGHSSMASCATFFLIRRYYKNKNKPKILMFGFLLFAMFSTMFARVMLDMHTISATIAGMILGGICAYIFTTPIVKNKS